MNNVELNQFIKNYFLNDKSQRALLLTAPWGTGKSFYIKNDLCPFLKTSNLDYAVVSLYGINDLKDISKNIYLEIRAKKLNAKNEALNTSLIIGKTIIKGIVSFFNVDLSQKEKDLEKLYCSIDLSKKLVILDDLERCNLNIATVLGFVNNLVEQDGAKVLLIANEDDILKYESVNEGGKAVKKLKKESTEYLKIKEKTIGDTIRFTSNIVDSITSIINIFDNKVFNELLLEKDNDDVPSLSRRIYQQMSLLNCFNYRSLLYACQKIEEILKKHANPLDDKFVENLLISTIVYSLRIHDGGSRIWDSKTSISQTLGTYAYPFYKAVYNYIEYRIFSSVDLKNAEQMFLNAIEISKTDEELAKLYYFYDCNESEIEKAIKSICDKLKIDSCVIHNEYAKIANYLIAVKYLVGFNDIIDSCIKLMISNAKRAIDSGEKINTFATSGIQLETSEQINELNRFIDEINEYQKKSNVLTYGFDYNPRHIDLFYNSILKEKQNFINNKGFLNKFDLCLLLDMLTKSSSKEIHCFRNILSYVYFSFTNIKDFFAEDLESLKILKEMICKIDSLDKRMDKIQMLQINYLVSNIEEIIKRLES